MGMDVYGKVPKNERGRYFRNNVWWWHPLAIICQELAPEIANRCKDWHNNGGDGLDRNCALKLGKKLHKFLKNGTIERSCRDTRLQLRFGRCPICLGDGSIKMTDQTLNSGSTMVVPLRD